MQMPETYDRLVLGDGACALDALVAALGALCAFAPIGVKGLADTLHPLGAVAAARAGDATRRALGEVS
ncbi:MAG: hypothetical protein ACLPVY_07030 [Acidimicrobiia bacterium]